MSDQPCTRHDCGRCEQLHSCSWRVARLEANANPEEVEILYKNWKGNLRFRVIIPKMVWHGGTKWHPEDQWLLKAYDVEDMVIKDFAMSGIQSWKPAHKKESDTIPCHL
jgi:predicted DNA-binding transcriptional regulator YafY